MQRKQTLDLVTKRDTSRWLRLSGKHTFAQHECENFFVFLLGTRVSYE